MIRGRLISKAGSGRRLPGLWLAAVTALISGVSVFVNSYGVRAVPNPVVYTTAKNLVAALVLLGGALLLGSGWRQGAVGAGATERTPTHPGRARAARWLGLAYVGVIGGGVAFVLFFVGLAHSSAQPAAFLHDTLVVWVVLLAWPTLRERASSWNLLAILLLVAGQLLLSGGIGPLVLGPGAGLVLAATMLWAVETVVAKRLLADVSTAAVAVTRMGVGVVVLVAYLAASGSLAGLLALRPDQWSWALITGILLSGYVASWMTALSRARAVDVTSVLVGSVLVTSVLAAATGGVGLLPQAVGLVTVAAGVALVVRGWPRTVPT